MVSIIFSNERCLSLNLQRWINIVGLVGLATFALTDEVEVGSLR